MAGMYGIGLSALGMLGSLPVALSVDGYGPISDNAGGCAEMSGLPAEIRDLTDALDAAGNTTAAVGKGFVIGSPLLAGFIFGPNAAAGVLAGAIVSGVQVAISQSNSGGAWDNAKKEVEAHRSAFRKKAEEAGVNLATVKMEYNKLLANRFSGVIADNGLDIENTLEQGFDKERFEQLHKDWMERDLQLREQHIAAVVGDTVGDPLKDTSGPAINILVKLSAITSLVFGNYLAHYHFFGNQPAPIRYAKELLVYCNSAGENPNSVDMVLKDCNNWLEAGYFTYHAAAPTKDTSDLQPGIAKKVWSAEDAIVKQES